MTTNGSILALTMALLAAGGIAHSAVPKAPLLPAKPTPARTVDVTETTFGQTVHDPYRWMEGQDNAEFTTWLKAQGDYGRARLDATPYLADWRARLKAATGGVTTYGSPMLAGGTLLYKKSENGQQGVVMTRTADGKDHVIFDPNQAGKDGKHASVTMMSLSPDGRIVALDVDHGGNEITTVELYDTATGVKLPDEIPAVWGEENPIWTPDGKAFSVTVMDAHPAAGADPMENMHANWHVVGTLAASDRTLLGPGVNASFPINAQEFPKIFPDSASDWAVAIAGGARHEVRVCVVKKADLASATPAFRCIAEYEDGIADAAVRGDSLYLLAVKATPNGAVLKLDLSNPAATLKDAVVVAPEDKARVLTGLLGSKDALYVVRMNAGPNDFLRVDYASGAVTTIDAPFVGSSYREKALAGEVGFTFGMDGWTQPPHLFRYDGQKVVDLNMTAIVPKTYPDLDAVVDEVVSRDGTRVPVTILQKKGYKPDGKTLVLLDGYAAYGTSSQPYFDPTTLEWVEAGHVLVMVSARGGGEKGEAWHLAGKGHLKYKGAEDMIAASDAMVVRHYTDYRHVGIASASAGGILLGQAMTIAPEKFGAVIIHAGELNPARLSVALNGANQYGEFGDATTADGFKSLYDMDPYLHVKPGTAYPPLMLEVGLNDSRVAPWNSGKFGSAVMAANPANDVLFNTQSDSGHFGTSINQHAAEAADHYAFLEMTLNGPAPKKVAGKAVMKKHKP